MSSPSENPLQSPLSHSPHDAPSLEPKSVDSESPFNADPLDHSRPMSTPVENIQDANVTLGVNQTSGWDETMVGDDSGDPKEEEKRGSLVSQTRLPPSPPLTDEHELTQEIHSSPEIKEKWDPLQHGDSLDVVPDEDFQVPNITAANDSDSILDPNGRLRFADSDSKGPSMAFRRASIPSPQPWDLIGPPADNVRKSGPEYYSTLESRKYDTLRSTSHTRPLIPKSSYYFSAPPPDSAYGTHPIGQIGLHHPREILRIERDYTGGELIQFAPIYPLELEGRITPTQFLESINAINEVLISAHSLRHSFLDNVLAVFSLQLSRLFITSHHEKEMQCLQYLVDDLNTGLFNPVGLNILWPQSVAFLYLEIEYY